MNCTGSGSSRDWGSFRRTNLIRIVLPFTVVPSWKIVFLPRFY